MRGLEVLARAIEQHNSGIWSANVVAGFSFADTHDTGVSFLVSTTGSDAEARAALDELAALARRTKELGNVTEPPVEEVLATLKSHGIRAVADLRNEKINYKIREHSMQKVPYILVVGDKEKASGAVAVRARGNQDLGVMTLEDFSRKVIEDIARKA